jgi:hypothetical protein
MLVTKIATADIRGLTLSGGNADQGGGLRNDTGATVADDLAVRQWQLIRAFDSVLEKARGRRKGRA